MISILGISFKDLLFLDPSQTPDSVKDGASRHIFGKMRQNRISIQTSWRQALFSFMVGFEKFILKKL